MTDVEKSLAQISSAAKRLNEKSDSINETIRRVEKALRESEAGLEFWSPTAFLSLDDRSFYLGYTRTSQDWCLKVREYRDVPNEYERAMLVDKEEDNWEPVLEDETLLLQTARIFRIAALAALPQFLDAYHDKIESTIATIERAAESLK
jgi:hypothetical protein